MTTVGVCASAFFLCGGESKWGLRLVREPLLRGRIGVGVEGSVARKRHCAWNGAGGVSASGVSARIGIGLIGPPSIGNKSESSRAQRVVRQNQRKVGLRHAG